MEGFVLDVSTACVFWEVCRDLKLETEAQRVAVLRVLVADKKATYLRDPQTYLKDKRVLAVKRKQ